MKVQLAELLILTEEKCQILKGICSGLLRQEYGEKIGNIGKRLVF